MDPVSKSALGELLRVSLSSLARQRLRTGLTALSVAAGIASVVSMMSVAEGARVETLRYLEALGARTLIVRSRDLRDSGSLTGSRGLTVADAASIQQLVPSVVVSTPAVLRYSLIAGEYGRDTAMVLGLERPLQLLRPLRVDQGRLLGAEDRGDQRVCVLGHAIARTMLGERARLPKQLRIDGEWFEVVGILARPVSGRPIDNGEQYAADLDRTVLAPLGALAATTPDNPLQRVTQIWLAAGDASVVEDARRVVDQTMLRLHDQIRDFEVVLPADLLAQRAQAQRIFNVLAGSVAALALLVGGIGIMNIQLASVVERTPEIGLRRVVGASRQWISLQFLSESLFTAAAGGLAGLALGIVFSILINRYAGWPTHISWTAAAASLGYATATALAFGVYPAIKASRLEPIDAVRFE